MCIHFVWVLHFSIRNGKHDWIYVACCKYFVKIVCIILMYYNVRGTNHDIRRYFLLVKTVANINCLYGLTRKSVFVIIVLSMC